MTERNLISIFLDAQKRDNSIKREMSVQKFHPPGETKLCFTNRHFETFIEICKISSEFNRI